MKTKTKTILVAVAFTVVGFMLNPNAPLGAAVWGEAPESDVEPTGPQIGLLMLVSLIESVAFGVGVSFLFFGRKAVARLAPSAGWALLVTLTIAWALVSWVPHSALHQTIGEDFALLIVIEYLFHVTLVSGAIILVAFAVKAAGGSTRTAPAPSTARVTVSSPTPLRRA